MTSGSTWRRKSFQAMRRDSWDVCSRTWAPTIWEQVSIVKTFRMNGFEEPISIRIINLRKTVSRELRALRTVGVGVGSTICCDDVGDLNDGIDRCLREYTRSSS